MKIFLVRASSLIVFCCNFPNDSSCQMDGKQSARTINIAFILRPRIYFIRTFSDWLVSVTIPVNDLPTFRSSLKPKPLRDIPWPKWSLNMLRMFSHYRFVTLDDIFTSEFLVLLVNFSHLHLVWSMDFYYSDRPFRLLSLFFFAKVEDSPYILPLRFFFATPTKSVREWRGCNEAASEFRIFLASISTASSQACIDIA